VQRADALRRQHQLEQCDERDFDTIEVLRAVEMAAMFPRNLMLDSGAFTVWNAGKQVTLPEVVDAYSSVLDQAGDLFEQVWLVNLDEIPGKPGAPEQDRKALRAAAATEDANLVELRNRFGRSVLPVIHQSRDDRFDCDRLKEVVQQGDFVCVSPDNSRPEKERVSWARKIRDLAHEIAPDIRLHGLATTGNVMSNGYGFYSVDSEAWSRHARYGSLDLYEQVAGGGYRYRGYHVSVEKDCFDLVTRERIPWRKANYSNYSEEDRATIQEKCERYGFPFAMVQWDARARSLINMGELGCFFCWEGPRDLIPQAA
jgi:hypothetical protein